MKPARAWLAMLGLLILGGVAGCGPRETPVELAAREGILLVGNGDDPRTLDPQLATGLLEYRILTALFEGLTVPDPATLAPQPGVAESWSYDEKTLTWTFHLRPTARWSNGDPVTARDFVFAYHRMLTPELGAEYANMLYAIRGAEAFNQGKTKDFSTVGVKAVDDHTLQIQLDHPVTYFLSLCYHQSYFPLHEATIRKFDAFSTPDTDWAKAGNLVGDGPFVLTRFAPGDRVEVHKNPYYWDAAHVALNGIRFFPIRDGDTEERAFRAGQLHITSALPPAKIPAYRTAHDPDLHMSPSYGTYYYLFNVRKAPLDNPKVRLALNLAVDRQAIIDRLLQGGQAPARSLTPPSAQYAPRAQLTEDVPAAKKLLAEAGYPGGQGFPKIELLYNDSANHRRIAEAIQQMWHKSLGIDVDLRNVSWPTYLDRRSSGDFQIVRASWYGDYLDPSTFLDLFRSKNELNHGGWDNPRYDELMAAAAAETDPVKRMEDFQQGEALLVNEAPLLPIYFYTSIYLLAPEVHGYKDNLLDIHPWQYVSLRPTDGPAKQP